MAFSVVDTDTCTCCRYLEKERVKHTGDMLTEAVDYLLIHYDGKQLMDGTFDHVVVRSQSGDVKASEALESVGWTKKLMRQELEREHSAY